MIWKYDKKEGMKLIKHDNVRSDKLDNVSRIFKAHSGWVASQFLIFHDRVIQSLY